MANGSEGNSKQTEPEGKQASQVRLEWGQVRTSPDAYCAQLTTCFLSVSAGNADGTWLGYVSLRCEDMRVFATKEKAQIWCEAQLTELLKKDLKSLGGGGNVAIPSITVPVRRTRTPGVLWLKLGEFDLKQADGSERTGKMFLNSSGSSLILQMPSGDEFTLGLGAVVESLAALPAEVKP